jgi:hypothetical protein
MMVGVCVHRQYKHMNDSFFRRLKIPAQKVDIPIGIDGCQEIFAKS